MARVIRRLIAASRALRIVIAVDCHLDAARLDTAAGCEFVDDRIRRLE